MKTHPDLIAIIQAMGGAPFTKADLEGFAGCQSEDPWLASIGLEDDESGEGYAVVADGNQLIFARQDDEIILQMI